MFEFVYAIIRGVRSERMKKLFIEFKKFINKGNVDLYFICCTCPSALDIALYSSAPGTA